MRKTSERAEAHLQANHKGSQWVGLTTIRRYAGTDKPQRKRLADNMLCKSRVDKTILNPYTFGVVTIASRALKMGADYSTQVQNAAVKFAGANVGLAMEAEAIDAFVSQPLWPNRAGEGQGRHDTRLTVEHIPTGNRSYKGRPCQDTGTGALRPVKRKWYAMTADDTVGRELTGEEVDALADIMPKQYDGAGRQREYYAEQLASNVPARVAEVIADAVPDVQWRMVRLDHVLELRHGGQVITVTDNMRAAWGRDTCFANDRDGSGARSGAVE